MCLGIVYQCFISEIYVQGRFSMFSLFVIFNITFSRIFISCFSPFFSLVSDHIPVIWNWTFLFLCFMRSLCAFVPLALKFISSRTTLAVYCLVHQILSFEISRYCLFLYHRLFIVRSSKVNISLLIFSNQKL